MNGVRIGLVNGLLSAVNDEFIRVESFYSADSQRKQPASVGFHFTFVFIPVVKLAYYRDTVGMRGPCPENGVARFFVEYATHKLVSVVHFALVEFFYVLILFHKHPSRK